MVADRRIPDLRHSEPQRSRMLCEDFIRNCVVSHDTKKEWVSSSSGAFCVCVCVGVNIKGAVMNHSGSCVACFSDADFILAQLLKLVITVLGSVGDRSRYVTWHLVLSGFC